MVDSEHENDNRRVYWHSRRGMVELDVLLMPFALEVYPGMDVVQRAEYRRFLESEDADLYAWLMGSVEIVDPGFAVMVDKVLEHGRARIATGSAT